MGKGPAAATVAPSNFVRGNGRRSGLSAALFHAAGGPSPSSLSGSVAPKAASYMSSSMGDLPRFDASSSSPVGRGGFTGSPSSSPAWWNAAANGGSPTAWDPTRNNNSRPPGGFMGILNNQANLHLFGAPSHYAPFKAPRSADVGGSFASMDASSPSDVEILSDKQPAVVDRDSEC
ncbi:uncharacterized protein [Miscanthus floridulus]|uniref:uncharacterized protein n=1 Tax=Miscanthus floridulus TaxID=154761 RepID=UPI00345AF87F